MSAPAPAGGAVTGGDALPASVAVAVRQPSTGSVDAVLYDRLGPRGRRRVRLVTVVVVALLVLVAVWAGRRLAAAGQFEPVLWSPLFDPRDPNFTALWRFLAGGLGNTLLAAGIAMVISVAVGTVLASVRFTAAPWYRWAVVGLVELLRGTPVVIAMFFAARVLPEAGIDLPTLWYVVIGLVVYNAVVIAEILRAGLAALPRGQQEAALALGLTRPQALRLVMLPQAFRMMLPALVSQLVVVLKDTSLGFVVLYPELLRRSNIAVQTTNNPIQMFLVVALVYVAINLAVGRLATLAERRFVGR